MKIRSWKPVWIALIVIAGVLLLAVIVGVLNATVGGGKWKIGWQNYRYEEEGYTIGGGTVFDGSISSLDVDWIAGSVRIEVAEDDARVSLSESGEETISETNSLRWKVENGRLIVKYRESGSYFARVPKKDLILRVPKKLMSTIGEVAVHAEEADVTVSHLAIPSIHIEAVSGGVQVVECQADALSIQTVSGNTAVSGAYRERIDFTAVSGTLSLQPTDCPAALAINTVSGDARVILPEDASFAVAFESTSGKMTSEFPMRVDGDKQVVGTGDAAVSFASVSANLVLQKATA